MKHRVHLTQAYFYKDFEFTRQLFYVPLVSNTDY